MDDIDSFEDTARLPVLPVNVSAEVLQRQRDYNRSQNYRQILGLWNNLTEVILLGGGPSLNKTIPQLDELMRRRIPVITVNGSYHWAAKHFIWPSIQIILDAREHNARFTKPVQPGTYYIIADTCHPSVFKGLPKDRVFTFDKDSVPNAGSTVMLTAIPLLKSMGMQHCSIFGFDSCITDQHHAYSQPENDADKILEFDIDGRGFRATQWMVQQAEETLELHHKWGDYTIYGDGLISWMLNQKD